MTAVAELNILISTFAEGRKMSQVELLTALAMSLVNLELFMAETSGLPLQQCREGVDKCIRRLRQKEAN